MRRRKGEERSGIGRGGKRIRGITLYALYKFTTYLLTRGNEGRWGREGREGKGRRGGKRGRKGRGRCTSISKSQRLWFTLLSLLSLYFITWIRISLLTYFLTYLLRGDFARQDFSDCLQDTSCAMHLEEVANEARLMPPNPPVSFTTT